tara:strand:+ start:3479 stop:3694 length:216 start_codon:yes stop_codon:yes gene_type:complete
MSYYLKNREKILEQKRIQYKLNKDNPKSSYFLPKRLEYQRKKWNEKYKYDNYYAKKYNIKINYGNFIIDFE